MITLVRTWSYDWTFFATCTSWRIETSQTERHCTVHISNTGRTATERTWNVVWFHGLQRSELVAQVPFCLWPEPHAHAWTTWQQERWGLGRVELHSLVAGGWWVFANPGRLQVGDDADTGSMWPVAVASMSGVHGTDRTQFAIAQSRLVVCQPSPVPNRIYTVVNLLDHRRWSLSHTTAVCFFARNNTAGFKWTSYDAYYCCSARLILFASGS